MNVRPLLGLGRPLLGLGADQHELEWRIKLNNGVADAGSAGVAVLQLAGLRAFFDFVQPRELLEVRVAAGRTSGFSENLDILARQAEIEPEAAELLVLLLGQEVAQQLLSPSDCQVTAFIDSQLLSWSTLGRIAVALTHLERLAQPLDGVWADELGTLLGSVSTGLPLLSKRARSFKHQAEPVLQLATILSGRTIQRSCQPATQPFSATDVFLDHTLDGMIQSASARVNGSRLIVELTPRPEFRELDLVHRSQVRATIKGLNEQPDLVAAGMSMAVRGDRLISELTLPLSVTESEDLVVLVGRHLPVAPFTLKEVWNRQLVNAAQGCLAQWRVDGRFGEAFSGEANTFNFDQGIFSSNDTAVLSAARSLAWLENSSEAAELEARRLSIGGASELTVLQLEQLAIAAVAASRHETATLLDEAVGQLIYGQ